MKALGPMRAAWPVLLALALAWLVGCIIDDRSASKRGSEVENELHGVLVSVAGDPVAGARVKALPAPGPVAKRAADSAVAETDARGRYSLRGLAAGRYNLLGDFENGTLVVLIPGVEHRDTVLGTDAGVDTLRAPGRIRGSVLLGDAGMEGVLIYVPGTSYLAVTDDSGRFVLSGIPQGRYTVRYSADGFAIASDSGVPVRSREVTDLPVKRLVSDPADPPPTPQGLKAVYDTLAERVLLTWDPVAVADLEGYQVFRDHPSGPGPLALPYGFTRGTAFADTGIHPLPDSGAKTLVYRIKARDDRANLSLNFSAPVSVDAVSRASLLTRLEWAGSGRGMDLVSIGDTALLRVRFANPSRAVTRLDWFEPESSAPIRTVRPGVRSGYDTLRIRVDEPGLKRILVRTNDESGRETLLEGSVDVRLDRPVAVLDGPKGLTFSGQRLALSGAKSRDSLGSIVKWEWRLRQGGPFVAGGSDTAFEVPSGIDTLDCILRVTDDDGNTSADTLRHRVMQAVRWTQVSDSSPVRDPTRVYPYAALAASHEGRIWAVGYPDSASPTLYSTVDGKAWTDHGVIRRKSHILVRALVSHGGRLWVGLEWWEGADSEQEILSTEDGSAWEKLFGRLDQIAFKKGTVVSSGGDLWALGRIGGALSSVMRFEGATGWSQVAPTFPVALDYVYAATAAAGRIWVSGERLQPEPAPPTQEVWSSADGRSWTRLASPFQERTPFQAMAAAKGALWLTGGGTSSLTGNGGLLVSLDGTAWIPCPAKLPPAAEMPNLVEHQGSLWIVGGFGQGWATTGIWRLD